MHGSCHMPLRTCGTLVFSLPWGKESWWEVAHAGTVARGSLRVNDSLELPELKLEKKVGGSTVPFFISF